MGGDSLVIQLSFDDSQATSATARVNKGLDSIGKMAAQAGKNGAAGMDQMSRALANAVQGSLAMGTRFERTARSVAEGWHRTTNVITEAWVQARTRIEAAGNGIVSMLQRLRHAHENVDEGTRHLAESMKGFVENPMHAAGAAVENLVLSLGKSGAIMLAVGAGLAVVAEKTFEFVKSQAEAAHEIELLAQRTGLTILEAQKYSAAAKVEGVDVGALTTMIRGLSQSMSENSDEGKKGKRALEDLGKAAGMTLSAFKPDGSMKETGEFIHEISTALSTVPEGAMRARLAIALLSRSAVTLLPLIGNVKEMDRVMKDFGLDPEMVTRMSEANKEITKFSLQWAQVKMLVAAKLVGIVEVVVQWHDDFSKTKLGKGLQKVFRAGDPINPMEVASNFMRMLPQGTNLRAIVDANDAVYNTQKGIAAAAGEEKEKAQRNKDDVAGGDRLRAADAKRRAGTLPGVEEALTDAKTKLANSQGQAENKGLGREAAEAAIKLRDDDQKAVDALEKRKKALTDAAANVGKLTTEVARKQAEAIKVTNEALLSAQAAQFTGLTKLQYEAKKEIERLSTFVDAKGNTQRFQLNAQALANIQYGVLVKLTEERNKLRDAELKHNTEKGMEEAARELETDREVTAKRGAHMMELDKLADDLAAKGAQRRLRSEEEGAGSTRDLQMQALHASGMHAGYRSDSQIVASKLSEEDQKLAIETQYAGKRRELDERASDTELVAMRDRMEAEARASAATDAEYLHKKEAVDAQIHTEMMSSRAAIDQKYHDEDLLRTRDAEMAKAQVVIDQWNKTYDTVKGKLGEIWDGSFEKGVGFLKALTDTVKKTAMGALKEKVTGALADMITPLFGGAKPHDPAVELAKKTDSNTAATAANTDALNGLNRRIDSPPSGGAAPAASGAYAGVSNYFRSAAPASALAGLAMIAPTLAPAAFLGGGMPTPAAIQAAGPAASVASLLPSGVTDGRESVHSTVLPYDGPLGGPPDVFTPGNAGGPPTLPAGPIDYSGAALAMLGGGGAPDANVAPSLSSLSGETPLGVNPGSLQKDGILGSILGFSGSGASGASSLAGGGLMSTVFGMMGGGGKGGGGLAGMASGLLGGGGDSEEGGGGGGGGGLGGIFGKLFGGGKSAGGGGGAGGGMFSGLKNLFGQNGPAKGWADGATSYDTESGQFSGADGAIGEGGAKAPGGFNLKGLGKSDAMAMGGMMLLQNGLGRNNALGLAEDVGGGAMVGFKCGGPIGAAVGAGVGGILGGLRMSGAWQTFDEQVKSQVHKRYGLVISKPMATEIAGLVKQKFGGQIDMAISSDEVMTMLELYAKSTGQNFPLRNTVRPLYLTQTGGHLQQQASYDNGSRIGFQSGMQTMGGPLNKIIGSTSGPSNPGNISLALDGKSSAAFLQGQTVDAINQNPRAVQSASISAASGSWGRQEQAGMLTEPGTIFG